MTAVVSPKWRDRLLELMQERGHTMKSLSRAAGLGETAIRDMVKRTRSPSLESLSKVANALGVPVAHLWSQPAATIEVIEVLGWREAQDWKPAMASFKIGVDGAGRSYNVQMPPEKVALIDAERVLVGERIDLSDQAALTSRCRVDGEMIVMTRTKQRLVAVLRYSKKRDAFVLQDGKKEIPREDIELLAASIGSFSKT